MAIIRKHNVQNTTRAEKNKREHMHMHMHMDTHFKVIIGGLVRGSVAALILEGVTRINRKRIEDIIHNEDVHALDIHGIHR